MSDAVGPGDLVLCVNAAPNHMTGEPVPLVAGETYRVYMVMDFAWCESRFRLLPKPKAQSKPQRVSAPKETEKVR